MSENTENGDIISNLPDDLTPDGAPGAPVAEGQYGYMVTTGSWDFYAGDPSGLSHSEAQEHFSTLWDGPYSSMAKAEEAADKRFQNSVGRTGRIDGPMEVSARGLRGPHGGNVEWRRYLTCFDHTGEFGDKQGWQTIQLVYVDELP